MQYYRVCVALFVVSLFSAATLSSYAFSTFAFGGGTIHADICRAALVAFGVSEKSINAVVEGCTSQDIPMSQNFCCSPSHHSDDNRIGEAYKYWSETIQSAIKDAGEADKDAKARDRALFHMGEAFHTVQDFYSHANYIEYLVKNNLPIEPIDWNKIPAGIRTGYYYYRDMKDNEGTSSRDLCVKAMMLKNPQLRFHSAREYDRRNQDSSLKAAEDYALQPDDFLHLELNKDTANTMEGKVVVPGKGQTLHELARKTAEIDTARQWKQFEAAITSRYGQRASSILKALKGAPIIKN